MLQDRVRSARETLHAPKSESAYPRMGAAEISILAVTDDRRLREELKFGFPEGVDVTSTVDARDAARSMQDKVPSVVVVIFKRGARRDQLDEGDELPLTCIGSGSCVA